MTGPLTTFLTQTLPPRSRLWRGLAIAIGLWLFFMVTTAYTSAVTLLDRVASTDVMRAASSGAWTSKIGWEVTYFLLAQVLLHAVFACLTWLLAVASAIVYPDCASQVWPDRGRLVLIAGGRRARLQRALVSADADRRLLSSCGLDPGRRVAARPDRVLRGLRVWRVDAAGRGDQRASGRRSRQYGDGPSRQARPWQCFGSLAMLWPADHTGSLRRQAPASRTSSSWASTRCASSSCVASAARV